MRNISRDSSKPKVKSQKKKEKDNAETLRTQRFRREEKRA
jgi:hypothetical protein